MTDTWHLMSLHCLYPTSLSNKYDQDEHRIVPLKTLAGMISAQLLQLAEKEEEREQMKRKRISTHAHWSSTDEMDDSQEGEESQDTQDSFDMTVNTQNEHEEDKIVYFTGAGKRIGKCVVIETHMDGNGNEHTLAKFPIVQTGLKQKKRTMVQPCDTCGRESTMFCVDCGIPYCFSKGIRGHGRTCFQQHIPTRMSNRQKS